MLHSWYKTKGYSHPGFMLRISGPTVIFIAAIPLTIHTALLEPLIGGDFEKDFKQWYRRLET